MKDAPNKRSGVACAGRLYCDLVFSGATRLPSLGEEVFAEGLSLHAGGGAFITAAWIGMMGRKAELIATLPAEPFGEEVRRRIAQVQVGTSRCASAPPGTDPQITVALPLAGDRAFLTRRAGPALPPVTSLDDVGHLHIGEFHTLLEHPELIAKARMAGVTISLDCGWEDEMPPQAADLISAVDVFLPNEGEAARLRAAGLHDLAPLTVIKCGANGSRVGDLRIPAQPTEVIDATGAGDAFNAGFLSAWLDGEAIANCLASGNAFGAGAVSAVGGTAGIDMMLA